MGMPAGFFGKDDIRFKYDLAGGSLMDIGCYNILSLREAFRAEPVECLSAEPRIMPHRDQKCGEAFKATFRFPNGGIGTIYSDNYKTGFWGLPQIKLPKVEVRHKEIVELDPGAGETRGRRRTVTIWLFPGPQYWHSIDVVDEHVVRSAEDGTMVRSWVEKESKKAYVWGEEAKREGERSRGL
jgi:predicted dehydrogenase